MAMVLLLPTEVGAWNDIKIHSDFKGWDKPGSDFKLDRVNNDDNNRYGVFDATGLTNGTIYEFVLQNVNNESVTDTYKGGFEYNFTNTGEQSNNLSTSGGNLRLVHNSKYKSYKFYATWNNGWTLKIIGVEGGGSETSSIIFYVSTSNAPNIYTWDPNNDNKEYSGSFPGLKGSAYPNGFDSNMTIKKVTDTNNADWYKVTVTGTSTLNLILNNNSNTEKTVNITIQNNKSYTYKGNKDYTSGDEPTIGGGDQPVSGIDPNAYYLVSPELTDGKLLPNFKMIASRNRSGKYGDGETSTKFFTINFKDDEIRTMTSASSFHWYISKGDKTVTYRPTNNNNYRLGIVASAPKGKNGNVQYETYNNSITDNTNTNVFEMPVKTGVSYTIFLNTDNAVTMNINKKSLSTDGKGTKDPNGYYLIGNFASAKEDVKINPKEESGRKKMTLYRYKNGFRYEESDPSVEDATADSLVYMVHVEKPVEGWGELYMDVAPGTLIKDNAFSNSNWDDAWRQVIRPQVSADKVDARALKGGLQEAAGGEMSLNPEVDGDLYDSYDFSMNLTTSTYRLVFNTKLYIVGDAVSTLDGKTGNSFNLEQKIPLTYDWEEGCYKYEGDGSMLHFDNGEQFRFVVNGKNYKTNYSENGNEPYSLNGGKYDAAIAGDETQYRNVVSYHNNGSESSEDPNESATGNHNVTFALASGDYVLRFYIPQDNEPYYTITHEASLVIDPEETVCSWGGKVNPTGRVILTDNGTTGTRAFIFTVDGSKPELVDGALPKNTQSATGTNLVKYEWNELGDKGNIPAISGTVDKKIMFGEQEISPAISASGNVILKAYAVITDPANVGKYMISGDMQTAVYKFRDGVIIEIVPFAGKFLRTYSYSRPLDLPKDESVKAYEAYRFEKGEVNSKSHGHVYLRRIKYIPANEGVVLVGEGTGEETFVRTLNVRADAELVTKKEDLWWKNYSSDSEWSKWNNYLVPTVEAVLDLGNVKVENEKITARYFGLGSFYETNEYKQNGDTNKCGNYIGFFRLTPNGRSGANKAYLSIPATENKYGYIDFSGQWLDDNYDDPAASEPTLAKTALIFDDIDFGDVTGINNVITNENGINDNAYYTLQGVRVAKPVQGLYIHNGKKVIIK